MATSSEKNLLSSFVKPMNLWLIRSILVSIDSNDGTLGARRTSSPRDHIDNGKVALTVAHKRNAYAKTMDNAGSDTNYWRIRKSTAPQKIVTFNVIY